MEEHRAAVLVPELLEEGETLLPQPACSLVVTGDGEAAAVSAQGMGASVGRDGFGRGVFEKSREPAYALARVVGGPEHIHRDRELEPECDRSARERPREGGAHVVLLGDRNVKALATFESAGIEIRAVGNREEELGVPATDILGLLRLVEPFERVLANRVEPTEAAAAP